MTDVIYREPTPDDITDVALRMRREDAVEVFAMSGRKPYAALQECVLDSSSAFTAVINGRPEAIFGFTYQGGVGAEIWMLGTDELRKHPRLLLVEGRRIVRAWGEWFPLQQNFVDAANTLSVRWLRMLGFRFDEKPVKRGGREFLYFWMHGNV